MATVSNRTTNDSRLDPEDARRRDASLVTLETLEEIERRVLWLSTLMIHHANNVRPNPDKPTKVGGHQASSSSVVTILTALYFHFLQAGDRVSIKPHASPAYHAIQYLLGHLDRRYLPMLRQFGGLQSYPSRTKDPDKVDFSTGSVGLGAVAPIFAAMASTYANRRFGYVSSGRFISLIGDAELDEGNIWETVIDESVQRLGNVMLIVDLNRQSLDRVIPGIKAERLKGLFAAAGWHVLEAKYGTRLGELMDGPHGDALRRRIDEMSNEEYQAMVRRHDAAEIRERLAGDTTGTYRDEILASVADTPDDELQAVVSNLGGHDMPTLLKLFRHADTLTDAPVVVFAYTVKGYGLPMAADPLNHSQLLSNAQMDEVLTRLGADPEDPWAALDPDSVAGKWCASRAAQLDAAPSPDQPRLDLALPDELESRHPNLSSTQEALGRALIRAGEIAGAGERIVTLSPDVATSTHLAGWINKYGVFAPDAATVYDDQQRMLRWQPSPEGRHIEFGISEMNLFMALSQFGLAEELTGQPLIPVGTVYDPFVCRGLDALIYGLYVKSRMIFAGTPAGVSLSPEGGAHQSSVTASLGIELPNLRFFEPAFGREVDWILLDGIANCLDQQHGESTYLRLSTKPIDQTLMDEPLARLGANELRRQVLAGGYRLIDRTVDTPDLPASDAVTIAVGGIMVPEAVAAARRLQDEGVAVNVINVTSADRLYRAARAAREAQLANAVAPHDYGHLETLFPGTDRRAPIVTVQDAASHSLAFLGAIWGAPVVPLGFDVFGQSGSRDELYQSVGIDVGTIVNAGMLALDLV